MKLILACESFNLCYHIGLKFVIAYRKVFGGYFLIIIRKPLKILIASSTTFLPHFTELGEELKKNKIDCKIIVENQYHILSRNMIRVYNLRKEYRRSIREFNPDFVLVDKPADFGLEAIYANKPLLILLRGDYWRERKIISQKMKKFPHLILNFWMRDNIAEKCFKNSTVILPVCQYLENIINQRYPKKLTKVLHIGIEPSKWISTKGMELKHPCVGLIQRADTWEKTKEMLILPEILRRFPNVEFYWAGDGRYKQEIISTLDNYKNFHELGSLKYPEKIRDFLSEIDVYALFSGLDMTPISILEANLMLKPIVATNVGGIPEIIKDKETGFLVNKGDHYQWGNHLQFLLDNPEKAKVMGEQGHTFIRDNFNLDVMVKNLISYCKIILK